MSMIEIENVGQPGKTYRVDAAKYAAMRQAYLAVLPDALPGLTPEQIIAALRASLPHALFPGGETAGWWGKAVQLDLEAKGIIARSVKPVRLYKV
jgi:hypothetical protein